MAETIVTKQCCKCNTVKPLSEFGKRKKEKDGFNYYCKSCCHHSDKIYRERPDIRKKKSIYGKSYRKREVSKAHEKERRKKKKYIERILDYQKRNPEKTKARRVIANEVRYKRMRLAKFFLCRCCNGNAREYHHHLGYEPEHWLDVIPLCGSCHYILNSQKQAGYYLIPPAV